jgi:hypothetical protein
MTEMATAMKTAIAAALVGNAFRGPTWFGCPDQDGIAAGVIEH